MWGYGPQWGMMGGWGYGYGAFQMLFWVVILIAITMAIVWMMRKGAVPGVQISSMRGSSALDVLEERYARGEIQRDEYLQKKQDISQAH